MVANVTDAAGNTGPDWTRREPDHGNVPNDGIAPVVEITEDANNDGFINREELDGDVDVKVSFNGDKVKCRRHRQSHFRRPHQKKWRLRPKTKPTADITTAFTPPANGTNMIRDRRDRDAAGNVSKKAATAPNWI